MTARRPHGRLDYDGDTEVPGGQGHLCASSRIHRCDRTGRRTVPRRLQLWAGTYATCRFDRWKRIEAREDADQPGEPPCPRGSAQAQHGRWPWYMRPL